MEPPRMFRSFLILVCALGAGFPAFSQSGTKGGVFIKRRPVPGVADLNAEIPGERPLYAVSGFDVLSVRSGAPKQGSLEHQATFDCQIYLFESAAAKQTFVANPAAHAPVLSGMSVVGWVNGRVMNPGLPGLSAIHKGRLYLFADAAEKAAFAAGPAKYEEADLMLGGVAPVALVDQEQVVMGAREHEAICEGWRVRFADAKGRAAFLADLGKYYPTFAGADPVALHSGRVMMGDPKNAFTYKNRLYLFANQENADRFRAEYKVFSDLDVAEGGYCPVSRVDENRMQLGKYGVSTIHLGRRLLFVNDQHRQRFLADPVKYLPDGKKKPPIP
jgi:YHS domain-containing protein